MLDGIGGSEVPHFLLAAVSLGAVLLLIAAMGWLARRVPPPSALPGSGMSLRGTLRLDARRRLHLVDVGGQQALVLTGGATDMIMRIPPHGS